ncbi:MAG: hypothetical protein LH470_10000 [Lysobacter sp.]|nr:hypothetical protein [Lysobacter sp.]
MREFVPAMLAYCVAILGSTWLLRYPLADAAVWARAVVGVLPMLPVMLLVRTTVRAIRDSDELQRRIDLEAAAIAGMVVGLGYFSFGLLGFADVLTVSGDAAMLGMLPLLCFVFGLAKHWARRRYQ